MPFLEIIRFYLDANKIRENVLELLKNAGSGHLGGSYSEAEILAVLFNNFLKMDPSNPNWTERDRFILSKGHANPGLYAILGEKGFFSIAGFRPEMADSAKMKKNSISRLFEVSEKYMFYTNVLYLF